MGLTKAQEAKAGEDLAAVAAYIREHGWVKGRMSDERGRVCLMGGINATLPTTYGQTSLQRMRIEMRRSRAVRLLEDRIKRCFPKSHGAREGAVVFNDARTRKVEDIYKVLEGGCE